MHWTPSPGAIYPRLSIIEDEGLITIVTIDGRKLATLTDSGKALVEGNRAEESKNEQVLAILRRAADEIAVL